MSNKLLKNYINGDNILGFFVICWLVFMMVSFVDYSNNRIDRHYKLYESFKSLCVNRGMVPVYNDREYICVSGLVVDSIVK